MWRIKLQFLKLQVPKYLNVDKHIVILTVGHSILQLKLIVEFVRDQK